MRKAFFKGYSQTAMKNIKKNTAGADQYKKRTRIFLLSFAAGTVLLLLLLLAGCGVGKKESRDQADRVSGNNVPAVSQETDNADAGRLEAVFFDVGKGDCILLSSGDSHVLLDTGFKETADGIIDELKERDISRLDAMIITHYDKDHVGGAAAIAGEIPTDIFYLPDYMGDEDKCGDLLDLIEKEKLQSVQVSSRQELKLGRVEVYINPALVSYDKEQKNDNDASLLIEIFEGEDSWFLPGDIEEKATDLWLSDKERKYDILKMPHHGKKEKNSAELIKAVSPLIAVITDGEERPASEKIEKKLRKNGADVYSTCLNGTITVTGNGSREYQVSVENP